MIRTLASIFKLFLRSAVAGRAPSRRAVAAVAKLHGRRLERRWPFLPRARRDELNLGFDDLLQLQFSRSRDFRALVIGAFDGETNDPASRFIIQHGCQATFLEPQPGPFRRLAKLMEGKPGLVVLNAAIDQVTGSRVMYTIPAGIQGLPAWAEQLASFSREHLLRHEAAAPGLSRQIVEESVPTICFEDLLDKFSIASLDLLQIDAEGFDAQLLAWFPFHRLKPALLYYETAHMTVDEHAAIRARLATLGYEVRAGDTQNDDMAILP